MLTIRDMQWSLNILAGGTLLTEKIRRAASAALDLVNAVQLAEDLPPDFDAETIFNLITKHASERKALNPYEGKGDVDTTQSDQMNYPNGEQL